MSKYGLRPLIDAKRALFGRGRIGESQSSKSFHSPPSARIVSSSSSDEHLGTSAPSKSRKPGEFEPYRAFLSLTDEQKGENPPCYPPNSNENEVLYDKPQIDFRRETWKPRGWAGSNPAFPTIDNSENILDEDASYECVEKGTTLPGRNQQGERIHRYRIIGTNGREILVYVNSPDPPPARPNIVTAYPDTVISPYLPGMREPPRMGEKGPTRRIPKKTRTRVDAKPKVRTYIEMPKRSNHFHPDAVCCLSKLCSRDGLCCCCPCIIRAVDLPDLFPTGRDRKSVV